MTLLCDGDGWVKRKNFKWENMQSLHWRTQHDECQSVLCTRGGAERASADAGRQRSSQGWGLGEIMVWEHNAGQLPCASRLTLDEEMEFWRYVDESPCKSNPHGIGKQYECARSEKLVAWTSMMQFLALRSHRMLACPGGFEMMSIIFLPLAEEQCCSNRCCGPACCSDPARLHRSQLLAAYATAKKSTRPHSCACTGLSKCAFSVVTSPARTSMLGCSRLFPSPTASSQKPTCTHYSIMCGSCPV